MASGFTLKKKLKLVSQPAGCWEPSTEEGPGRADDWMGAFRFLCQVQYYFAILFHVLGSCYVSWGGIWPTAMRRSLLKLSRLPLHVHSWRVDFKLSLNPSWKFFLENNLSILLFQESMLGTLSPVLILVASKIGGECIENWCSGLWHCSPLNCGLVYHLINACSVKSILLLLSTL